MLVGIFGTGRNGSTLLGRLLDGSSDTYVHPVEENFLCSFDDLVVHKKLQKDTIFNARVRPVSSLSDRCPAYLLRKLIKQNLNWLQRDYLDETDLCTSEPLIPKNVLPDSEYSFSDFVCSYLNSLSKNIFQEKKRVHVFKSIETQYIDDYHNTFPSMKFIHILRDPVNTCSSAKRTLMCNKSRPAHYLGLDWLHTMIDYRWLPHAKSISRFTDNARHLCVKYEDLIDNPESIIKKIASFIGVEPPSNFDTQTVFGGKVIQGLPRNVSKKNVETPLKVSKELSETHAYEAILTKREINYIRMKCSFYLEKFSYDGKCIPSPYKVFLQYLIPDFWEFKHLSLSDLDLRAFLKAMLLRRIWSLKSYD